MDKGLRVEKKLFWRQAVTWLSAGKGVALVLVTESRGSSPGRKGFKMLVNSDGELSGSIGGGIMELRLVKETAEALAAGTCITRIIPLSHNKNKDNASGLICSGTQTLVVKPLNLKDLSTLKGICASIERGLDHKFVLTYDSFGIQTGKEIPMDLFASGSLDEWHYVEAVGSVDHVYVIGGGHVGLATCRMLANLDFKVTLLDNRKNLNTISSNSYAHDIKIIPYEEVGQYVSQGDNIYVLVMTFGYITDKQVMSGLLGGHYRYFGMMGSKVKAKKMMRELLEMGFDRELVEEIKAPIGVPIKSKTPAEIAVSVAADLVLCKNTDREFANVV